MLLGGLLPLDVAAAAPVSLSLLPNKSFSHMLEMHLCCLAAINISAQVRARGGPEKNEKNQIPHKRE